MPEGLDLSARPTLTRVSFCVERGEWVALLGANGSGKSTLARLANGLLLPSSGEVLVDGVSSWQHTELLRLRKMVGLVAQDPDNQMVSATVFDEVAFGPQNLGWEPERIYAAVSRALTHVNLPEEEFARRDPNTLSGGEKQRVVFAAVLAMEPHYLVLDEPTAMLDPKARAHVLEAVEAAQQQGQGIVHITHSLKEASFASRIVVLREGRLVYDGAPKSILSNRDALKTYGLLVEPVVKRVRRVPPPAPASALAASSLPARATATNAATNAAQSTSAHETSNTSSNRENPAALALSEVSFSYKNSGQGAAVFQKVSFELSGGQCLLLVGASGAGKSTLLSLAAGLLQPDSGTVRLRFTARKAEGRAPNPGEVGIVFQQPERQLFAQTVAEDILFGPGNLGMPTQGEAAARLVEGVLTAVGLRPQSFKERSPFTLSGGEARRVALATTLALDTRFLLLDEPTAGLDARGKAFVFELLQELLIKGKGVILATHDPEYFAPLETSRLVLGGVE